MTLGDYLVMLKELCDKHPEALQMEVFTSRDDEGNDYNKVYCGPSIGMIADDCGDTFFLDEGEFKSDKEWYAEHMDITEFKANAILIN